jgi:AcrR family transcriptional regulator
MSKERRRLELLAAARQVFAEKGFHEAKVGDIAAAANVAKGTVYLYFEDKRSILVELVDTLFARISAIILRVDPDADVAAQIKHNIRGIIGVLVDEPQTLRILFAHASAVDPAFSEKIDSFYRGLRTMLSASLADGQRLGIVAAGDVQLYATFTMGALKEILLEATTDPSTARTREQIVELMFELLQAGYLRIGRPSG